MSVFTKALVTVGAVAVLAPVVGAWARVASAAGGALGNAVGTRIWDWHTEREEARRASRRTARAEASPAKVDPRW